MDDKTKARVAYLRAGIRKTREFLQNAAADAELKGAGWAGYEPEKVGEAAVLSRFREMQDELQALMDGTASEREV